MLCSCFCFLFLRCCFYSSLSLQPCRFSCHFCLILRLLYIMYHFILTISPHSSRFSLRLHRSFVSISNRYSVWSALIFCCNVPLISFLHPQQAPFLLSAFNFTAFLSFFFPLLTLSHLYRGRAIFSFVSSLFLLSIALLLSSSFSIVLLSLVSPLAVNFADLFMFRFMPSSRRCLPSYLYKWLDFLVSYLSFIIIFLCRHNTSPFSRISPSLH